MFNVSFFNNCFICCKITLCIIFLVYKCKSHEFRCDDGLCVDKRRLCDGIRNCPDGTDEYAENCDGHYGQHYGNALCVGLYVLHTHTHNIMLPFRLIEIQLMDATFFVYTFTVTESMGFCSSSIEPKFFFQLDYPTQNITIVYLSVCQV